jgi:flagellar basal body rod protein FlgB
VNIGSARLKVAGVALCVALVGAACGGSGKDGGDTSAGAGGNAAMGTSEVASAPDLTAGAPALVQGLTDLLDGHVYLAAIAVEQAVLTKSTTSPQFEAAATALDGNSVDLADAIASVYGDDAGDQFLELWRKHIGFFVDYTAGRIGGDKNMQSKALAALDNYKEDFSAFLSKATGGELPADAAAEALQAHVDSLVSVIDAVVDGSGNPFDLLYAAASEHMPHTATALAGAIAAQYPEKFEGAVDSAGSVLQQTLTDQLDGHVYLAAIAVEQAVLTKSTSSAQFKAAATALDRNSVDLSKSIESVYGADAGKQFLSLWRKHIGFFVDYTAGRIGGDDKMQSKALAALDDYKVDFSTFLAKATGGELPADAAAEALQAHVDSLVEVIDAVVDGSGNPFELLYTAASEHMPHTATALAGAIAAQSPEKFPTTHQM